MAHPVSVPENRSQQPSGQIVIEWSMSRKKNLEMPTQSLATSPSRNLCV